MAGIVGWGDGQVELLLEDNETNYNCCKGNLYQYEGAGVKLHIATDCIIRRHRSHRNRWHRGGSHATLPAELKDGRLMVTIPEDAMPGQYAVVISRESGWFPVSIVVAVPFDLLPVPPVRSPRPGIRFGITNHRRGAAQARVPVEWEGGRSDTEHAVAADGISVLVVELPFSEATPVKLKVDLPGVRLTRELTAVFPTALPADTWDGLLHHAVHTFPGGIFPKGAEAFVLYKGILTGQSGMMRVRCT